MQEDFKNQLQNVLELWKKKGRAAVDELIGDIRFELQSRLSQQGVAERWPSMVNLIEEILPQATPAVASLLGKRFEPMAAWLGVTIKSWNPYRMELEITPRPHLLQSDVWQGSAIVAMAELAARWLVEKHAPPGDLKMHIKKLEMEVAVPSLFDCTARCEIDPVEFEDLVAKLMRHQRVEMSLPVNILSPHDVLLSQVNFHFEMAWAPLLK